ncbi:hypothetical protein J8I87_28775 [Paraburkholderia sp. LEh10]|uniref:hypothetical protein n=1 Tax=Paraburkholderia sp. LEh10 TaxID=2821353 RepID=UPI001AE3E52E|nr:hypothetical protein [Paraburkholderia sp. LEh10]MBP0593615.1 hypothetical protein [Paraburkholderia sp. LEh10]
MGRSLNFIAEFGPFEHGPSRPSLDLHSDRRTGTLEKPYQVLFVTDRLPNEMATCSSLYRKKIVSPAGIPELQRAKPGSVRCHAQNSGKFAKLTLDQKSILG